MQAGPERISLRVGGQFSSEESLRGINLRVNDRFFRLSDVATIAAATPTRRRRCSATTASRRSGWPSA